MSAKLRDLRMLFIFLIAIGMQLIFNLLTLARILLRNSYFTFNLAACLLTFCLVVLFIKLEHGKFKEHGFCLSRNVGGAFSISLLLAVISVIVNVFILGSITNFEAFPQPALSYGLFTEIFVIFITNIAIEALFRGYLQIKLKKLIGFPYALLVSSVMSTLYISLLLLNSEVRLQLTILLPNLLTNFAKSCFLGVLFNKTRTLLSPIVFSAGLSIFYLITPLKVLAPEYLVLMVSTATYAFLVLLLQLSAEEEII